MARDYSPLRGLAAAGPSVHVRSTTVVELLDELDRLRAAGAAPAKAKRNDYPADFEAVWEIYPARPGDSKRAAHKAWAARRSAGATVAELLAGAQAYASYVKAMRIEPMFIKQSATFFGPAEHYAADWTPPEGHKKAAGGAWWSSDATILAKGAELGLSARAGEYMWQFKARIEAALDPAPGALPVAKPMHPPLAPARADRIEQRKRKPDGIGALRDLVRGDPAAKMA